jgi:ATP-dependent DNA helicase RecQ
LQERVDAKTLFISKQHYAERKEVAVKKMEGVIYYAFSKHKCRSQILLAYFGENDSYRCGVCDVCLERNKLELSDIEFSNISDQIKKILNQEYLPITLLVNKIQGSREDKIIKVIQWLTENEKLVYNEKNLLEWRK